MRNFSILLTCIVLLATSCQHPNKNAALGDPERIASEIFTISLNRDTVLLTSRGARIDIPIGTLATQGDSLVQLEIREAYSLEEMIRGGLTTSAGGEPLSSGGMINIQAKGGQDVRIAKPMRVSVPAPFLEPGMRLYKGETDSSGRLNWTQPQPLSPGAPAIKIDSGMILFQAHCATCHGIGKDGTGPNLAHFLKQFPPGSEFYDAFCSRYLHGSVPGWPNENSGQNDSSSADQANAANSDQEIWGSCSKYYLYHQHLRHQFGSVGTYSQLSRAELATIYRYVQNESDRQALPVPNRQGLLDCLDSCQAYKSAMAAIQRLEDSLEQLKRPLTSENRNPAATTPALASADPSPQLPAPNKPSEQVVPEENYSVYYQFSIESFGWYNIDVLSKEINGNLESSLLARVTGRYREKLDIFLILPDQKTYVRGGPAIQGEGYYAFNENNGKIFLPQHARGYILAMKETESSIAWALRQFTTSSDQTINLQLNESTMEEFKKAVESIGAENLSIRVAATTDPQRRLAISNQLKSLEEKKKFVQTLEPKTCGCSCSEPHDYGQK